VKEEDIRMCIENLKNEERDVKGYGRVFKGIEQTKVGLTYRGMH
jgi:hypothetical protein